MSDDKIKKFPLSKEARQRLALRKRGKKYRMSFEPSYASKEEYEALLAETPTNIDWSELQDFEKEDNTAGSQTYACSGDSCEVVDLT